MGYKVIGRDGDGRPVFRDTVDCCLVVEGCVKDYWSPFYEDVRSIEVFDREGELVEYWEAVPSPDEDGSLIWRS